jgi:AcrR family transcriptional regulator
LHRPPRLGGESTNSSRVPLATARDLLGKSLEKSISARVTGRLEFFVPGKREQQSVAKTGERNRRTIVMPAAPEPPAGRSGGARSGTRGARLSREIIVNAALTFLDREGWDALTINALATQLGTKGPSLYNHVNSLEDLRRTVRIRVIDDIITMLNRVGEGRSRDDAVLVMASAYRSYAHHHPGRYSAFTRMPLGAGDDPEYTAATRAAAAPVIAVLTSYGLDLEQAFYAALEFWSAMHGFVLLEMTGVMDDIDTDSVFSDMVLRLAAGMALRSGASAHDAP